jgi:glc operon protein GlcG
MYQSHNISHAEALKLVEWVRSSAEKAGKAVCVAVSDTHGELMAFLRMDGCQLPSIYIAQNKAFTSSRERAPSGEVGSRMRDNGDPMTNYGNLRYTAWDGGMPITHAGKVIGAIGVSGLSGKEDLELAAGAVKALGL